MIDSWNLMTNWNQIIPPSRPSKEQLQYLTSFAKGLNRTDAIAVLGSTMEFRDLFYELGFKNIFVFDRNREFYEQTTKDRIYQNRENFIEGNWVDTIEKFRDKFRLIVSDLTSGNISYEFRLKFYTDIENALVDQGHFYDKVLTHESFLSVAMLIEKYQTMPVNNVTVNHFSCEFLFCSELLEKTRLVETTTLYKQIKELSHNARIHKFIDLCKTITPEGFVWYYGKYWRELSEEYCKTLIKLNELEDYETSPYFKRVKLFHLFKSKDERI
jgi:hypothetical protein